MYDSAWGRKISNHVTRASFSCGWRGSAVVYVLGNLSLQLSLCGSWSPLSGSSLLAQEGFSGIGMQTIERPHFTRFNGNLRFSTCPNSSHQMTSDSSSAFQSAFAPSTPHRPLERALVKNLVTAKALSLQLLCFCTAWGVLDAIDIAFRLSSNVISSHQLSNFGKNIKNIASYLCNSYKFEGFLQLLTTIWSS